MTAQILDSRPSAPPPSVLCGQLVSCGPGESTLRATPELCAGPHGWCVTQRTRPRGGGEAAGEKELRKVVRWGFQEKS